MRLCRSETGASTPGQVQALRQCSRVGAWQRWANSIFAKGSRQASVIDSRVKDGDGVLCAGWEGLSGAGMRVGGIGRAGERRDWLCGFGDDGSWIDAGGRWPERGTSKQRWSMHQQRPVSTWDRRRRRAHPSSSHSLCAHSPLFTAFFARPSRLRRAPPPT